jgi:geranylgeranyl diphosphate synthase type II
MANPDELGPWVDARRAELEALFDARLPAATGPDDPGRLGEAMRYSLLAPGKRLRPLLALAAAEAVGGRRDESVTLACASVELLHCYSLIHDDLPAMDDDDFRRGKPSNHKVFGEATAILAGDALLTLAFEWIAEAGIQAAARSGTEPGGRMGTSLGRAGDFLRASAALARGGGMKGMVRGQARDLGEPAPDTLAALEVLHREKTAALFKAALEVGAAAGGADAPTTEALARYGECYGIAFQHADDLDDADHPRHAAAARGRLATLIDEAVGLVRDRLGDRSHRLEALARELYRRAVGAAA